MVRLYSADGSVREKNNSLQIGLNRIDKEHLVKFSKFISLNKEPIDYLTNNSKKNIISEATRVSVSSFHMISKIKSLGIFPNKSNLNIDFLSFVPSDYKLPFIFGYFDGDGSLSKGKAYSHNISFVGNLTSLNAISSFLNQKTGISIANPTKSHGSDKVYNLVWGKEKDVLIFCNEYIKLLKNKVFLSRKMLLIKECYKYLSLKETIRLNDNKINENILNEIHNLNTKFKVCPKCKEHIVFHDCYEYCNKCSRKPKRKTSRPSKEVLLTLILTKSFLQIGKDYGVSDNAVRKWCKHYGLLYRKKDIKEYLKNNNT